jgi:hypothetical protein
MNESAHDLAPSRICDLLVSLGFSLARFPPNRLVRGGTRPGRSGSRGDFGRLWRLCHGIALMVVGLNSRAFFLSWRAFSSSEPSNSLPFVQDAASMIARAAAMFKPTHD